MARVPIAEGVFTWPSDEPQLIGSRCAACAIVMFPAQDSCPRCPSTEMAEHLLSRRGRGLGPPRNSRRPRPRTPGPWVMHSYRTGSAVWSSPTRGESRDASHGDGGPEDGHGDGTRAGAVPYRRRWQRGRDLRIAGPSAERAPALERLRGGEAVDVAIVGVGLHPFGRFKDQTGIDMGAIAILPSRTRTWSATRSSTAHPASRGCQSCRCERREGDGR